MPRVKNGAAKTKRRNKVLKRAEGFYGRSSKIYRTAKTSVMRALRNNYVGRKLKKRNFRKLWIIRLNAAVGEYGLSYSKFINGLHKANIELNRKALSNLAIEEPAAFKSVVEIVKGVL